MYTAIKHVTFSNKRQNVDIKILKTNYFKLEISLKNKKRNENNVSLKYLQSEHYIVRAHGKRSQKRKRKQQISKNVCKFHDWNENCCNIFPYTRAINRNVYAFRLLKNVTFFLRFTRSA